MGEWFAGGKAITSQPDSTEVGLPFPCADT